MRGNDERLDRYSRIRVAFRKVERNELAALSIARFGAHHHDALRIATDVLEAQLDRCAGKAVQTTHDGDRPWRVGFSQRDQRSRQRLLRIERLTAEQTARFASILHLP